VVSLARRVVEESRVTMHAQIMEMSVVVGIMLILSIQLTVSVHFFDIILKIPNLPKKFLVN